MTDEIIQDSTLRLLYLQVETPSLLCILSQVRSAILSEAVHCPAEKAVLLASFGVQAKYGNQDTEVSVRREGGRGCLADTASSQVHEEGYLASDNLLPPSVINGHKLKR